MGNIATYTDANGMVTYTYDAQGQLLSASDGTTTYSYMYDTVGNILAANGHTYTYSDSDWKDLLTAVDDESITYDTSGNPTSYYNGTRWTFGWEQGRRLTTATDGTTSLSFTYDADGLRTSKTVDGVKHTYYYASGKLLRESYGNTTIDFFYDTNGHPYALSHKVGDNDAVIYYYITNLQGDVMSIVDAQGTVVASYEYDPYGNIVTASGTLAEVNPIRYRGYYFDSETGMYYLQSRYYDPEIGRFINADAFASTGQGLLGYNMFSYCLNNPIRYADANGRYVEDACNSENDEDEFRTVGAGIQISGSASCVFASFGGGIEVIIYWDTPEAKEKGGPIIAIYLYGEIDAVIDVDSIDEILELLIDSVEVMQMDGINGARAIIEGTGLEVSISGFSVKANSDFYGVQDYTRGFSNESVNFGSLTVSRAWSDSCRTTGIGYTYAFGQPALRLKMPSYSRGKSYYWLLWSSE